MNAQLNKEAVSLHSVSSNFTTWALKLNVMMGIATPPGFLLSSSTSGGKQ
jgi:hypothetical protein